MGEQISIEEILKAMLGTDEDRKALEQKARLGIAEYELDPHESRVMLNVDGEHGAIYVQATSDPLFGANFASTDPERPARVNVDRDADGKVLGVEVWW